MEFRVDKEKRQVVVISKFAKSGEIILNELDLLKRRFLEGTKEKYECELILKDIELRDKTGKKTGKRELKAFARRKGVENWLMEFIPEEYIW